MQYYKVVRKEVIYQYVFVKAESPEEAEEIAQEAEGDDWMDGKYFADIDSVEPAQPEEMKGLHIETAEGSEIFNEFN